MRETLVAWFHSGVLWDTVTPSQRLVHPSFSRSLWIWVVPQRHLNQESIDLNEGMQPDPLRVKLRPSGNPTFVEVLQWLPQATWLLQDEANFLPARRYSGPPMACMGPHSPSARWPETLVSPRHRRGGWSRITRVRSDGVVWGKDQRGIGFTASEWR